MDYSSLLELVKKRRSIRSFKPEPMPDEYVDKIIEVARWAPSGANSQPWEFIVVKKQELRDKFAELIKSHQAGLPQRPPGYVDAPVYIILCGDIRTNPLGATPRAGLVFNSGLANAFLYMHLAATTLGLASQWVSATAGSALQPLIKEFLGMPEELEIYDMMAVGYSASEPRPRLVRAREEMVHYDYYDKSLFRTEERIREVSIFRRQA